MHVGLWGNQKLYRVTFCAGDTFSKENSLTQQGVSQGR